MFEKAKEKMTKFYDEHEDKINKISVGLCCIALGGVLGVTYGYTRGNVECEEYWLKIIEEVNGAENVEKCKRKAIEGIVDSICEQTL